MSALAAVTTDGDVSILFILVALGCFIAAAVAAWRGAWPIGLALAAIGVLALIFGA